MIVEGWTSNQSVRLHYLDSNPDASDQFIPVVFIPGGTGTAEMFRDLMLALAPRRSIALSLRGRGQSDAPPGGYSFEDHVADIEAVVKACELKVCCLMGFSAGVPFAIECSSRNPEQVAGLIIGDYVARYPAIRPAWADRVLSNPQQRMKPHAVWGIQQESSETLLWDALSRLECPVLVMRGGQAGSLLSPEEGEKYQRYGSDVRVIVFEESGHILWEPDWGKFVRTIGAFLEEVDET